MTVSIRRDVTFTCLVIVDGYFVTYDGPQPDLKQTPWMPINRIGGKEWQLTTAKLRGQRPVYRINAHLKPIQRPE